MVLAVPRDVFAMIDERVADCLLCVSCPRSKLGQPVYHILHQVEAIKVIEHTHVEGRRSGAFFLITAHVQIDVIGTPVREPVDQPRVTVKRKDDLLVGCKKRVEIFVA